MNTKKHTLTNEIFKDKVVPEFFKIHPMFSKPSKLTKVFPSIGLPNFKDKTNIQKSFADLKKETSYVSVLVNQMHAMIYQLGETATYIADKIQWLDKPEARKTHRDVVEEHYKLSTILSTIVQCIDITTPGAFDNIVQMSDGKINLVMPKDILGADGKPLFRKGEGLFRVYGKIKEKADKMGLLFQDLNQNEYFKNFCKENVPNKEYSINFSSDGTEGAWDLATMSMRGIKSCQRWDGEYPKCLIGSILSKFVGIIYLTSGVSAESNAGFKDLGTKMIRRCVVRYAIDADSKKPCILIDKMYPDFDKEIGAAFMQSIQSKTTLPVMFAADLGNKIKHLYSPSEKMREDISDRELSYQDTPLKSKQDLNIYILDSNKEDIERDTKGFYVNLGIYVARKLESVYNGNDKASDDLIVAINNIRSNTSFAAFADSMLQYIQRAWRHPPSRSFNDSKSYYRRFLLDFLKARKNIMLAAKSNIGVVIDQNTSRQVNKEVFVDYLTTIVSQFIKSEAKRLIN